MSYYNYYLDFVYCVPGEGGGEGERQIVMVLPDDAMLASSSLLPSFSTCGKKGLRPRFFVRKALGVGGGAFCKSFIYVWHLHNEAGSQWQPRLAGDRVACLGFLMGALRKLPILLDISHSETNVLWVRVSIREIRDEQVNYTSMTASPGDLINMIREVRAAAALSCV